MYSNHLFTDCFVVVFFSLLVLGILKTMGNIVSTIELKSK